MFTACQLCLVMAFKSGKQKKKRERERAGSNVSWVAVGGSSFESYILKHVCGLSYEEARAAEVAFSYVQNPLPAATSSGSSVLPSKSPGELKHQ